MENEVVLVTGCSSGIGKEVCNLLIADGYKVYGISRNEYNCKGLHHLKVDVTDKDGINNAVKEIITNEGKIDVLISNAGMGISSPIETTKIEDAKKIFDINFFGAINVINAVLPYMREKRKGKIIITSSVASKVGLPFQAFYSASKASLDSIGFALNLELHDYNIKTCNILPGDTKTGFTGAREKQEVQNAGVYAEVMERSVGKMEKDEVGGMSPKKVASVIAKMVKKKRMPIQRVVGGKYRVLTFLIKLLPLRLANYVVRKMYG